MPDTLDEHEQALIQRAVNDHDAFQELYQRYFRRVYGYVAARIVNRHDAEDVVSDIFLGVVKNLNQLRNRQAAGFAAWLFIIARHAIADYYRRNGHAKTLVHLHEAEPLVAGEPEPEQAAGEHEAAAQLQDLIGKLPERKREIITLRYYGGLRNHEIALVLGIGEKTVSAYLNRALNELHQKYAALKPQDQHRSVDDAR